MVTKTEYVYPPDALTAPTPLDQTLEESRVNGDLLLFGKSCAAAVKMCNDDKARIRALKEGGDRTEEQRSSQ